MGRFFYPKITPEFNTDKGCNQISCVPPKVPINLKANHNKGDNWVIVGNCCVPPKVPINLKANHNSGRRDSFLVTLCTT